ncbi:MAG: NlpC/P60 family protein [Pseudomonadota bacterium]
MTRSEVLAEARSWLGTPYRHQASRKGVGADCLGLVRGVWRACIGPEPEAIPPYTPDWAEDTGEDTLLNAARRYLVEIPIGQATPGDVLLFRMASGAPAKHCAIISASVPGAGRILHAYWGRSVCETALVSWWQRRIAASFSFPDLENDPWHD